MGLLDDAIREHLELKRKHGADPDEVKRQEREALGASTRQAEFAAPGEDQSAADDALDRPRGPADEEQGEDVLEDTPDFLQETPEHDRLWFEQKPPRDFDWDK
jgi:hypothetical protein